MSNNPEINRARLSGLLIAVGTPTVKKLFEQYAKDERKKLSRDFLHKHMNKSSVTVLLQQNETTFDTAHAVRKLQPEQYKILKEIIHDQGEINSIDLTLFLWLFRTLKLAGWSASPKDKDLKYKENLEELRMIRNKLYGHIAEYGIPKVQFDADYKKLSDVLLNLGANEEAVSKWKSEFVDVKEWKKKLSKLMESDTEDILMLKDLITEHFKTLETLILRTGNEMHQKICSLYDQMSKSDDTFNNPTPVLDLYEATQHEETIAIGFRKMLTNLHEASARKHRPLCPVELSTKQHEELSISLQQIRECLKSHAEKSFKVLVCTSIKPMAENVLASVEELASECGHYPWNLVLDFDHRSQSGGGIFDPLTATLRKEQSLHTVTYEETNVDDSNKSVIARGDKCLWILANGSESQSCDPSIHSKQSFAKAKRKITRLVEDIVEKICLKRPVIILTLILNNDAEEANAVSEIKTSLEEVCLSFEEHITIGCSSSCTLITHHHCGGGYDQCTSKFSDAKLAAAPYEQIAEIFRGISKRTADERFILPGNPASWTISKSFIARVRPWMVIYHKEIGKLANQADVDDIKLKFLRGNSITSEALRAQDIGADHVYVKRKEIIDIEEKVRKLLAMKFDDLKHGLRGVCTVYHEPSAGGTTCGRHLLYTLRNSYPCIELQTIGPEVPAELAGIFRSAQIRLLIMIDGTKIATGDIISLQRRLENDGAHALFLRLQRIGFNERSQGGQELNFHLPSAVSGEQDINSFKRLYNSKSLKGRTVFQFGLNAFQENYEKLNQHVTECMRHCTDLQRKVVRLVCIVRKYSSNGVPLSSVFRFLGIDSDTDSYDEENLMNKLGYVADLLVVDSVDRSDLTCVKPSHFCLLKHVFEYFDPTWSLPIAPPENQMDEFINDLKELIKTDRQNTTESYQVINDLFRKPEAKADAHWSTFISDLAQRGNKFVARTVKLFVDLGCEKSKSTQNHWAHLRSLLARYLIGECDDVENAIKEIRIAVGLNDGDSVSCPNASGNSDLWDTYGLVYKKAAIMKFKKCMKRSAVKLDDDINELCATLSEAAAGYSKAQKCESKFINSYPFCNEAKMKADALQLVLKYKFNNNREEFSNYLQSDYANPFLRDAYSTAVLALDQLQYYISIGRVAADKEGQAMQQIGLTYLLLFSVGVHCKGEGVNEIVDAIKRSEPFRTHNYGAILSRRLNSNVEKFAEQYLKLLYEKINGQILHESDKQTRMPRVAFLNIIVSMICLNLRSQDNWRQYNIDYAVSCAQLWQYEHRDDINAKFYLAVLQFTKGLTEQDAEKVKIACQNLKKVQMAYKHLTDVPGCAEIKFKIAKGRDLQKLLPKKYPDANSVDLEVFYGRQIDKNKACIEFNNVRFEVKMHNNPTTGNTGRSQERGCCHVGISRNRILALDWKYTDED